MSQFNQELGDRSLCQWANLRVLVFLSPVISGLLALVVCTQWHEWPLLTGYFLISLLLSGAACLVFLCKGSTAVPTSAQHTNTQKTMWVGAVAAICSAACAAAVLAAAPLLMAGGKAAFAVPLWLNNPTSATFKTALLAALIASVVATIMLRKPELPATILEEASLDTLGAAIRPHFFFNALNAVLSLIRSQPSKAEDLLLDTAELFRDVMNQNAQRLYALRQELAVCERYLRIEQARLGARLQLRWEVDQALLDAQIPPFTLQPLLENAIRHGIEPMTDGGELHMRLSRHNMRLHIEVLNPIAPVQAPAAAQSQEGRALSNGIALNNIRSRLWLMYAQDAKFKTSVLRNKLGLDGGISLQFLVQVSLPLEFDV